MNKTRALASVRPSLNAASTLTLKNVRTPPASPRRVPESPASIEKLHRAHQAKVNELEQYVGHG